MTREGAIKIIESECYIADLLNLERTSMVNTSLDMAIKALEQEPILDKIRAEIDGLTYYWCEVHPRSVIDDVLKIIDKYKAESEDTE